jgi:hypothetical protein
LSTDIYSRTNNAALGKILWRIDHFLGSDLKTYSETTFAARQQILKKQEWTAAAREQLGNMFPLQRISMQQ